LVKALVILREEDGILSRGMRILAKIESLSRLKNALHCQKWSPYKVKAAFSKPDNKGDK